MSRTNREIAEAIAEQLAPLRFVDTYINVAIRSAMNSEDPIIAVCQVVSVMAGELKAIRERETVRIQYTPGMFMRPQP